MVKFDTQSEVNWVHGNEEGDESNSRSIYTWKITQKKFELVKNATSCSLNYIVLEFFLLLGNQSMSGFWCDRLPAPPPLSGLLHRPKHIFLPRCPDFPLKKIRPRGKKASDLSGFCGGISNFPGSCVTPVGAGRSGCGVRIDRRSLRIPTQIDQSNNVIRPQAFSFGPQVSRD